MVTESRNRLRSDRTIASPASFKSFGGMLSGPVDFLFFSFLFLGVWIRSEETLSLFVDAATSSINVVETKSFATRPPQVDTGNLLTALPNSAIAHPNLSIRPSQGEGAVEGEGKGVEET